MHPVLSWDRLQPGRGRFGHYQFCGVTPDVFPAKAGPTECIRCCCGTGFSREGAGLGTINSAV